MVADVLFMGDRSFDTLEAESSKRCAQSVSRFCLGQAQT
jgi:hypothetical protein